jgi:amino acid transporter
MSATTSNSDRRRVSGTVKLGVIALAMINVAAIVSAGNLPVMAECGWSMLALFALSIAVFLLPIAMTAAELGTAWCKEGGVFAWVKEAFGGRTGFLAVWCDYSENIAWFPTYMVVWLREGRDSSSDWCPAGCRWTDPCGPRQRCHGTGRSGMT